MKSLIIVSSLIIGACATPAPSPATRQMSLAATDLSGTWDVALFYSVDAPPSATQMVLNVDDQGELSGSFYGSPFEEAGLSLRSETLAFGAVTSDGTGPYNHSGRYVDGRIEGQTLSTGRDFLMIWTAERHTDSGVD